MIDVTHKDGDDPVIFRMVVHRRPKPKQSMRFTRSGRRFLDEKVREYEEYIASVGKEAMARCDIHGQLSGNLIVHRLFFVFKLPQNAGKEAKTWCSRSDHHLIYRPTTPDIDNLQKMVWDGLKGTLFDDDSSIVAYHGTVGTFYGRRECTELVLSTTRRTTFECCTMEELVRTLKMTESPL